MSAWARIGSRPTDLSDPTHESRCLIGRVALYYRTSRTSRTSRTAQIECHHTYLGERGRRERESRGRRARQSWATQTGGAPLRGARSIGIGHPRSGDQCIAPHPSTTTPPGCRRAEPHFPATPGGVVAYGVCLYIGRRHFVPRPMPMERASYGCWGAGERAGGSTEEGWGWASDLSDSSDKAPPRPIEVRPTGGAPRQGCIGPYSSR